MPNKVYKTGLLSGLFYPARHLIKLVQFDKFRVLTAPISYTNTLGLNCLRHVEFHFKNLYHRSLYSARANTQSG